MRVPHLSLSQILIIYHLWLVASAPDIQTSTTAVTNPLFAPTLTSTPNSNSKAQGHSSNYSPSRSGIILGAVIGLGVLFVLGLLIGVLFCRGCGYRFLQRAGRMRRAIMQRPAMDADVYAEIERRNAAVMAGPAVLLGGDSLGEGGVWMRGAEGMEGK
jgi:hypothetical protein